MTFGPRVAPSRDDCASPAVAKLPKIRPGPHTAHEKRREQNPVRAVKKLGSSFAVAGNLYLASDFPASLAAGVAGAAAPAVSFDVRSNLISLVPASGIDRVSPEVSNTA